MPSKPNRAGSPRRCTLAAALTATAAIGAATLTAPHAVAEPFTPRADVGNLVVEWNRTLLSLVQTPGAQPGTIHPTRDFAIMSAAVYDAVTTTDPDRPHDPLHPGDRQPSAQQAAAAQAAHDVLTATFPAFAVTLDQQLATDLAAIPPSRARAAGIRAGARAAADQLQARAADGSATPPPPYQSTGAAGDYRPTPPGFAAPVFTHWGRVTPFVLRTGDQFRPAPPASLSSPAYAAAINEVKDLGQDNSTTRTAEQTTIGQFWAAPIQNYWNAIADDVVLTRHSDTRTSARTLALVDLGLADATIALYDAKYTYRLWRPITAIRLADTDTNPLTTADPTWTPLASTPPDPSYPGAHSTLSAAAATVLTELYGNHLPITVSSPTLPGVTRFFDDFHDAATEAGLSRIYAGLHTRLDHQAGLILGGEIGRYTLRHALSHDD
jgi:membrane-associated phospholipid phosphatase